MSSPSAADKLATLQSAIILDRADLRTRGMSARQITAAVRDGRLTRIRRGVYAAGALPAAVSDAIRIGGRIACVTLLHLLGVFVLDTAKTHVQVRPNLSRSRHRRRSDATLHWVDCRDDGHAHAVSMRDAVLQSIRCQAPRAAIATLDSVLNHRLLTHDQIVALFSDLPDRYRPLLALVDGSAGSGPETFVRLMLRALGLQYETQVQIPGVGRVDFLVEGWLIIECDSKEFHEGWEKQVEDRSRDLEAACQGYITIRPLAADIFSRADRVREAIKAVVDAFSGRLCRVARS